MSCIEDGGNLAMKDNRPFRLGRIDYANAWPLFHYISEETADGLEIVRDVPSGLNRALQTGDIDMSAISSFSYAENADRYYILPELSVSSPSRVNSILLFLNKPLDEVLCGTIAVTNTSATSVNLLRVLMEQRFGGAPTYVAQPPNLDAMLAKADAALLIGDPAIRASWQQRGGTVLDLGELWRNWTGHGMTFALVAVRRELAPSAAHVIERIYRAMQDSKRRSLQELEPLVSKARTLIGGTAEYWHRYFTELKFDFGPREQAGLQLYYDYAYELGLLKRKVKMEYWPTISAVQVNE